jgi:hypothetical protein
MRPLLLVSASLASFLPAASFPDEPAAPKDFAMELVVSPKAGEPPGPITIRCIEGCDWAEKSFVCDESSLWCRAVVASRADYQQKVAYETLPMLGSVCTGLSLESTLPPEQKCEPVEDEYGSSGQQCVAIAAPGSRAYVVRTKPDSPAEKAGLIAGDLVVSINDVPIRGSSDLATVLKGAKSGDAFTALIERDGAPMTLHGHFGINMFVGMRPANKCAVATPEVLKTAQAFEPVYFTILVEGPDGNYDFECLEGCVGSSGTSGSSSEGDTLGFSLRQDAGGLETGGRNGEFPEPAERM